MDTPISFDHQPDLIDRIIEANKLRIQQLYFNHHLGLILVLLNNGVVITQPLSDFKLLAHATPSQLQRHEIEENGGGVHWPDLDEDLSLRGFIQYARVQMQQAPQSAVGTEGPFSHAQFYPLPNPQSHTLKEDSPSDLQEDQEEK